MKKKTFEDTDTSINLSKRQHNESYGMTEKIEPYIPWHNIMRINPLVPVTWKQRDEYNDVLQKIHGKDHRLGCTSLATVQLMTYWKYPNNFDANGIRINWNDITREKSISDYGSSESEQAIKLQIQTLCYVVSGLCNTWYMKNNSMSFPKNSLEVLGNLGYRVPDDFILYKKSRIEESLKNSCPVIAYGASETTRKWSTALVIITLGTVHKTIPAHVWLIDGFIKQEKTDIKTITYTNVPDKLSKRQPLLQPEDGGNSSSNNTNITDNSNHIVQKKYYVKSYREFIHMNWGWGDETTKCWYLADVFDCSDAYTEYNGSLTYNELDHDSNFSNVHIATDIHPKQ